jgi:hypothetical protein
MVSRKQREREEGQKERWRDRQKEDMATLRAHSLPSTRPRLLSPSNFGPSNGESIDEIRILIIQ